MKNSVEFLEKLNQELKVVGDNSKYVNEKYNLPDYERDLEDIEQIIIHCTAAGTEGWENPMAEINYAMNPNHISKRGCATASYHFYINQKGEVWQLVSMNYYTWNCGAGQNKNSVAICINHNGTDPNEITPELYETLIDTICYIMDKLDWGVDEFGIMDRIHFHRDYSPKLCPGAIDKEFLISEVSEKYKSWGDNV
jgi:N-acetylmuramoyl-L-alanine amidase CwlA